MANTANKNKIKIAGLADIHVKESSQGHYQDLFRQISEKADILCLCGDLTDLGRPSEAQILVDELKVCQIPVVLVLGNHDFQNDQEEEVRQILRTGGCHVLDTESVAINGIGFAGTKGFGGGFEKYALGSFGEKGIKNFVQEALNEVLMLENQLKELENQNIGEKIVLMHYSPIRQTLIGEPPEIWPFLGSSRFTEPIDDFEVKAVFHGHAHHGSLEGKTIKGIPVYNAAYPLLQKLTPKQPYVIIEV